MLLRSGKVQAVHIGCHLPALWTSLPRDASPFTTVVRSFVWSTAATQATEEQEIQLVWPPPAGFMASHPHLSPAEEGDKNTRERAGSGAEASSSLSQESALEERRASVGKLLREQGVKAATLAKSNLQKLPVKVIHEELRKWGISTGAMQKPLLVEEMYEMVSNGLHSPIRTSTNSSCAHSRSAEHISAAVDMLSPKQVADWLVEAKTQDVCVIDVRHICMFADFMVLATGRSHRHVYAAASGVGWQVHEHARHILQGRSLYIEGEEGLDWISVDIGSIVVHVFTEEARRLYNLEALWARPGKVQTAGRTLQQHMPSKRSAPALAWAERLIADGTFKENAASTPHFLQLVKSGKQKVAVQETKIVGGEAATAILNASLLLRDLPKADYGVLSDKKDLVPHLQRKLFRRIADNMQRLEDSVCQLDSIAVLVQQSADICKQLALHVNVCANLSLKQIGPVLHEITGMFTEEVRVKRQILIGIEQMVASLQQPGPALLGPATIPDVDSTMQVYLTAWTVEPMRGAARISALMQQLNDEVERL